MSVSHPIKLPPKAESASEPFSSLSTSIKSAPPASDEKNGFSGAGGRKSTGSGGVSGCSLAEAAGPLSDSDSAESWPRDLDGRWEDDSAAGVLELDELEGMTGGRGFGLYLGSRGWVLLGRRAGGLRARFAGDMSAAV